MNEYLQAILTMCFLAAMMWGMLKFMLRDIHNDLINIKSEISDIKTEMKDCRKRTDNLYQICIDLLKEKK